MERVKNASIWKTLRQKPVNFSYVVVLTKSNKIKLAFYDGEDNCFMTRVGHIHKIDYKRWCYEYELVEQIKQEIKKHK